MTTYRRKIGFLGFCGVIGLALVTPASAFDDEGRRGRGGRRGPPPEAIAACEGQAEGVECTVVTPRGDEIAGSCETRPAQLVCVPEGGPPRGRPPCGERPGLDETLDFEG